MALCPTCHSEIGTGSLVFSDRVKGAQGEDADGNPIPFWSDDPTLTSQGLSGSPYIGLEKWKRRHIQELQELRAQQEIEAGLDVSEQTTFSDIDSDDSISRRHYVELRESTEKILGVLGVSLEDYFKFDAEGNEQTQNPELVTRYGADDPQTEWIDVNRGESYIDTEGNLKSTFDIPGQGSIDSPTIPSRTKIKAIHIEDLRHPIVAGIPALLITSDDKLVKAFKGSKATFRQAEEC